MKALSFFVIMACVTMLQGQTKVKSFYFLFDQNEPTEYSQNQLKLFAESVQNGAVKVLEINAFTDSSGTNQHNDTLSNQRLNFISMQIPNSSILKKHAYALERPYQIENVLNWRRVDVIYEMEPLQDKVEVAANGEGASLTEGQLSDGNEHLQNDPAVTKTVTSNAFEESLTELRALVLDISFKEGTAQLLDVSKHEIAKLVAFLDEYPNVNAQIRGHVCCGNNLRISKNRAKSVYKELIKEGIGKNRLSFKGMSNTEPLVFPERTSADRQKNRRVDVKLSLNQ
ncbi:MAG: OmpA family protein [Bacteroidota bacterium]